MSGDIDSYLEGDADIEDILALAMTDAVAVDRAGRIRGPVGLTKRQKTLLDFIKRYRAKNGVSPSVREMCAGIGTTSTGRVAAIVDELVERGHIRFIPNRARSIVPVSA